MNDFESRSRRLQADNDQMGRDFAETKARIARSHRRSDMLLCVWTLALLSVLGFGCWCVYHVLKAKGLVP